MNRDAEALRYSNIFTSNIFMFGIQLFGKRRLEVFRAGHASNVGIATTGVRKCSALGDDRLGFAAAELGCGSRKAANEYGDRKRNKMGGGAICDQAARHIRALLALLCHSLIRRDAGSHTLLTISGHRSHASESVLVPCSLIMLPTSQH